MARSGGRRRAVGLLLSVGLLACSSGVGSDESTPIPDDDGDPAAALVATEDKQGSFMTPCEHSHRASDDPIVHAGHTGLSHLHEFFGSTTTDAASTAESLLAGDTTCQVRHDRSAYWVPTLLVAGEPVAPTHLVAYYRVPLGADAASVQVPPNGLELLAGDPDAVDDQDPEVVHWRCGPRGEPSPVPRPCRPGTEPMLVLMFEPCWDGVNLGSADHRSHVAPVDGDARCPDSHPVLLPQLMVEARYPDRGELGEGEISLASGPITGGHGDALLAWDPDFMERRVGTCLNGNRNCDVVLERSRLNIGLGVE